MKCLYSMLLLLFLGGLGFAAVGDTRTITYYLNGGVNDPANPDSFVVISGGKDECAITLQDPTREGSRFLGWYEKSGSGPTPLRKEELSRCSGSSYWLIAVWTPAVKEPQLSADSCYQITTKEELYAIPKLSTFACIELQNDIVVNENLLDADGNPDSTRNDIMFWEPFEFGGIFEGNGHTISGLYSKRMGPEGFFLKLYQGAGKPPVVRNLGIKDSYFEGSSFVGGIAGYIDESALLVNVFSEATVVSRSSAGGIVGGIVSEGDWSCLCAPPPLAKPALAKPEWPTMTPSNVARIINAYNAGRVTGAANPWSGTGGIIGEAQDFILENAFNVGTVSDSGDAIFGYHNLEWCYYDSSKHHVEIKNSYYAGDATAQYGGTKVTENEFKDGTLLGKLQAGTYGAAWEQNVGVDPYPVLSSNVRYYLDYKLNGGVNSDKNPEYYTIDSAVILSSPT
ncbi:MAG: InlB B-repeat-containing protein, partial [Fibrobacter sp.]|nr:InlB B-repeat-containing protein [Fibrobacter sp.]